MSIVDHVICSEAHFFNSSNYYGTASRPYASTIPTVTQ